ncbi:hypothetical protein BDP27DRAFT_1332337 [Rhodocollybia butyracea]|uniref:F-box domain-containing protein n=1 Tax=Rhodocollybia butyracea TaxID=206335 RepID=A0A9P5U4U9_9AGAR|nr:hypothetical protein BDP27DRAFT_1332337 [Rhodocollybia butyracea]
MAIGTPADRVICFRCRHYTTPRTNIDTVALSQRFRSEYGPATMDMKEVAELLEAVDKDLEDYESEILLLQSRIMYIKAQQTQLKKHAAVLRSLRSPIRRFPNEILSRIFDFACDKNLLQEFPWSKDFKFVPSTPIVEPFRHLPAMSISSVCTRWRSVALSSPAIWSRISLELSPENSRLPNVQLVLSAFLYTVELHLHRSGQQPLTIELDISGALDAGNNVIPYQLLAFDLVCNYSWRSFTMGGYQPILRFPMPGFNRIRNCHSLENLRFVISGEPDDELELFTQADGLHSITLYMIGNLPTPFWTEIASLTVECMYGEIANVFNYASSPKELVLGEREDQDSDLSPCVPPLLCTSVSTLKLKLCLHWDDPLADIAFSSFTFPSLSCLAIVGSDELPYEGAWPKATLAAFLRRSSCNLTEFEVKSVSVSDIDLIAALKLMPSLMNLYIDDTHGGDDPMSPITSRFIRSLHGLHWTELRPSGSTLVPKLRELKLTFDGSQFDDSLFIEMVNSRWLPDTQYASGIGLSCLRVVTLRFNNREVDPAVYRPLDYLDKAGMMVVVLSGVDD